AGPWLVQQAIDSGLPPLLKHGDYSVVALVGAAFACVTVMDYFASRHNVALTGQVSQALLFDLRRRVFQHFQRLSIGFHERFTSGRIVSRMTSDMDSIRELSDNGVHDLVLSGLNVVSIAAIMLWMDTELALVALTTFPVMALLANW